MTKKEQNKLVIYQAKDGAIELNIDKSKDTIWASQADIVRLFDIDQSGASRHIGNIFKNGEVPEKSNMQKMHIANSDKPVALLIAESKPKDKDKVIGLVLLLLRK